MPGRAQKLPERKRPEGAEGDSADREREAALLQPNLLATSLERRDERAKERPNHAGMLSRRARKIKCDAPR